MAAKKFPPELEFVSWSEFHRLCFGLAIDILNKKKAFGNIVSISRGGHVISRILSDFLRLPIFNVSIQSYKALKREEVRLIQKLGQYLERDRVLLVDEIVDSGRTLNRALKYLKRLRVASVYSVAVHIKPGANPKPDFFARETDKWVVYPYELQESIEALFPHWRRAGWDKQKMKQVLIKGGFEANQVEFFLEAAFKNSTKSA